MPGSEVFWICAAVIVVALLATPCVAFFAGTRWEKRANEGALTLEKDDHEETATERDEWKRRFEDLQREAKDAVERAVRKIAEARQLGSIDADPDDDSAFDRVLQLAAAGRGDAGAGPAPDRVAAPAPSDGRGAAALEG